MEYRHTGIVATTLPEAQFRALKALHYHGKVRDCPAYNTREKAMMVTIDIIHPLWEPMISKIAPCGPADLQQYVMEMTEGIMDFEYTVAGNWPYTYHDRMIEQLIDIVRILKEDSNSRRAVVVIRRPQDISMDDPPCLQMIQFMINNHCLDCYVTFRSNDAVKAFFMNAFALIQIQKTIAEILGVGVGHYIHTANSFHAYEKDWGMLESCVKRYDDGVELTDFYISVDPEIDDWYGPMQEAIPDIRAKVKKEMEKYGMTHPGYYVGDLEDIIRREFT